MRKFILLYRHLIVLLWEVLIFVIFKLTINFKFTNGLSILFISLIVIFPLIIYIWSFIKIRNNRRKHLINTKGYFEGIKRDYKKNIISNMLINKINELDYDVVEEVYDDRIMLIVKRNYTPVFLIEFNKQRAKVVLLNTLVIYRFYYTYVTGEFTKYDLRNFEYKDTDVLYDNIYEVIAHLVNNKYMYSQKHHLIKLTRLDLNEDVYVRKIPYFVGPKITKDEFKVEI